MSDSSKPQMIMLFGNKMLVISDSGEILLDNQYTAWDILVEKMRKNDEKHQQDFKE